MKNKKENRTEILGNLINVGHFEFSIPSSSPEDYVKYLQKCRIKQLALDIEDRDLKEYDYIRHASFSFRKDTGRIYIWAIGTIYRSNHLGTVAIGELNVERNFALLILFALFTVPLIKPTILENLRGFSFGILLLLIVASFWIWIGKRQTIKILNLMDKAHPLK